MTDNGSSFRSRRYAKALRRLGIRRPRTKPYTAQDQRQGRAVRPDQLREWAHAYPTSADRAQELPRWLHRDNWHRPHGGIGAKPPLSRLAVTQDNLLRLHS